MSTYQPIVTDLGVLSGRDCINLLEVDLSSGQNNLTLKGWIEGYLTGEEKTIGVDTFTYNLEFFGVLAMTMIELDSWDFKHASSFDEVIDSNWIKKLGGKVDESHKHYLIQTYDEVFEVVCERYELILEKKT